ncbi:GRAS family protein [Brevibacillus migulae]|uniref:GRAS family protein n=1 Tax=Brevibacillus migulae TaxID=1644114 RepID=UPI00106E3D0C|nr:GRAS family protein [Brevibacillus migulae]
MNHMKNRVNPPSPLLRKALQLIQANLLEAARHTLSQMVGNTTPHGPAEDVLSDMFAAALSKRLTDEASAGINLYLKQYEHAQIDLFNLAAQHLPFVGQPGIVANSYLAQFIAGQEEVTLLEIGIGTGRQVLDLLQLLEQRNALPRSLTIFAIEPMADVLEAAKGTIANACKRLGVELSFHAIPRFIEQLSTEEMKALTTYNGRLCVNAAFSLHHIHGSRADILRSIHALNPSVIVLCEPNSDHYEPDLVKRFENAWAHFGAVFAFIDQLQLSHAETVSLKMFFYREIEDIIGNQEASRYERHEPVGTWVNRLQAAGFRTHTSREALRDITAHALITPNLYEHYVGFDYQAETLVAVICAVPR